METDLFKEFWNKKQGKTSGYNVSPFAKQAITHSMNYSIAPTTFKTKKK